MRTAYGGTTQISVCNAAGNVASMTTSNGEGSGYIVPGAGIMLNNMMGEDDLHPDGFHASPPGVRVASMMAPSLLLDGGQVRLVLGSGGSKRIRTAILQVLSHVIDHGLPLQEAVDAPRLHWDGDCLQVEPGFTEMAIAALRQRWPIISAGTGCLFRRRPCRFAARRKRWRSSPGWECGGTEKGYRQTA